MCLIQGAFGSSGADEFNTQTAGAAADLAPDEDFGRYRIGSRWAKAGWARCIWPSSANPFAAAWRSRS